ncbi:MAG: acyltransferase [Candidatus Peribacteraceae bacterium]|nr:acyltransferase [Candidatus Peribacteraceae bacterium]
MKDSLEEIGFGKALRFAYGQVQAALLRCGLVLPPVRTALLKVFGARIGRESVLHACSFFNIYRGGFRMLQTGHHCFIGDECLFDLAGQITLGDHVTLAERVTVLTHMNVGFHDHPLQPHFPPVLKHVSIGDGSFIGANVTILPGVTIGRGSFIGASSLVREDVPDGMVVAGVPARVLRSVGQTAA